MSYWCQFVKSENLTSAKTKMLTTTMFVMLVIILLVQNVDQLYYMPNLFEYTKQLFYNTLSMQISFGFTVSYPFITMKEGFQLVKEDYG